MKKSSPGRSTPVVYPIPNVRPENIHTKNIIQTELSRLYLEIYLYTHTNISMFKQLMKSSTLISKKTRWYVGKSLEGGMENYISI